MAGRFTPDANAAFCLKNLGIFKKKIVIFFENPLISLLNWRAFYLKKTHVDRSARFCPPDISRQRASPTMDDSSSANPDPSAPGSGRHSFHAFVRGRVQGVGFRFFVLREARRLGLAGSVRNTPDGRVEVLAQGPQDSLRELERLLHKGPMFGRVDQVNLEWDAPVPKMNEFTIGF
jgi:acylphosphatase